jgi:TRAP-type mannitol/chloroaromatic compound transport system substrate-binding protein
MEKSTKATEAQTPAKVSRRKFLTTAAVGATGAAAAGFPMISSAQSPINMRWQSTWPAKDIFHEFALDYAKKVNDMSGGELKIEVLPAGAVVPAFGLLEAVSKGTLDGGHGVLGYHYGKQNALAIWNTGPAFGMDANMVLAWHKYGGGKELLAKLYNSIGANVESFIYGPMPTQPLGWFKKPITKAEDFKGLKFRTNGLAIDMFTAMGAAVNALPGGEIVPAMDRGLLDGAEFNNASLRPPARLPRCVEGLHAAKLPPERRDLRDHVQQGQVRCAARQAEGHRLQPLREAASADMQWKALDRYSKDYVELQTKDKVKFYKTPDAILQTQLKLWDEIIAKKSAENALFKEIIESQRVFAERVVKWESDTLVNRRMAVNHFFGAKKT